LPLAIDSSALNIVDSAPLSYRNRVINGDCLVAQRGNVAAVNNAVTYGGADRIFVAPLSFTTFSGTIQKGAFNEGVAGYGQVLSCTTTGSGMVIFGQRIESLNTVDLKSKTVTFSGTLYQDTGSTVAVDVKLHKANAVDNFSAVTQLGSTAAVSVPSGVATNFTLTVALGSTDAANGIAVEMAFKSIGAVTNKLFIVSNLQLEVGSKASAFERRPYGMELGMCQRYFYKLGGSAYTNMGIGTVRATDLTKAYVRWQMPVPMRTKPILNTSGSIGTINASRVLSSIGALDTNQTTELSAISEITLTAAWTEGLSFAFGAQNDTSAFISFYAEL
jgi:hypothetical protein